MYELYERACYGALFPLAEGVYVLYERACYGALFPLTEGVYVLYVLYELYEHACYGIERGCTLLAQTFST